MRSPPSDRRSDWLPVLVTGLLACGTEQPAPVPGPTTQPEIHFDEITAKAGVDFSWNFPAKEAPAVRLLGAGAVAEDLDGDGHIDLYVAQAIGPNPLFWNRGDATFEEGAAAAGAALPDDWSIGVGAADYDNDGDQDLFVVNRYADRLLRNEGGRTFKDVGEISGFSFPDGGPGVSFGDLDGDGWLDAFIGGAALGTPGNTDIKRLSEVDFVDLSPSHLIRGHANGTFEEVTDDYNIPLGNPLIAGLIDLDADADVDLFIVQDAQGRVKNVLYENAGPREDNGFVRLNDVSLQCGCEEPWAGMGMAVLDIDDNGLPDLHVSNLWLVPPNREALLLNRGGLVFQDVGEQLGAYSMDPWLEPGPRSVSWATVSLDVENDSLEDIFVVYGELIWDDSEDADPVAFPHLIKNQPDALLSRRWDGRFEVQENTGLEDVGRAQAAVIADFDSDGCEDVYIVNLESPAKLYRNRCASGSHFIELTLQGTRSNRDAIGARVRIEAGGRVQWRQVLGCSTGFHSCMPKRLHFGLGQATQVDKVEIHWPTGEVQNLGALPADRRHTLIEPQGPG